MTERWLRGDDGRRWAGDSLPTRLASHCTNYDANHQAIKPSKPRQTKPSKPSKPSKPTQPVFMRLAGQKCPVSRMGAGCWGFGLWARGSYASRKNGLVWRSWPKVLSGPWPGVKVVASPRGSSFWVMLAMSWAWLPWGKSLRPTEPAKSTSPTKAWAIVGA